MLYRRYTPPQPLAALVDCFWYSEGFEGTHQQERLLPNGESGIVFDLRQEPIRIYDSVDTAISASFAPAVFCGSRTDCFVIDTSAQERVLGIQFKPGGAFPILGMPASEVANATYSLDDVWPGHTARMRERCLSASSVAAMFAILEEELLARLARGPVLHVAVSFAVHRLSKGIRVRDVAEQAGLSSRRLIDLFEQQTGLAPKAFQRVRRFQRALRSLHSGREAQGAALAAACGYYDQAHFIHDFRTFAGMTPGEYVTVATPHLNHVPLQ
jgi:AraC-like DNA-binding protein